MKTEQLFKVGCILALPFTFSACVDDNYDLDNLDSTVQIQVKDLVLPVNVEEISLKNIIEIEETEQISLINNQYVFIEDGEFSSSLIDIPQVLIPAPVVDPVLSTIYLDNVPVTPGITAKANSQFEIHYPITSQLADFTYETYNVSDYIQSIDNVGVDFKVSIQFEIQGLEDIVSSYTLSNFSLQIPAGLSLSTTDGFYDIETGVLTLADKKYDGSKITFTVDINHIDITKSNLIYNHDEHSVNFSGQVGIYSGEVVVSSADLILGADLLNIPQSIDLVTHFDMSDITFKSFTGTVNYVFEGLSIAPIELYDLPEILTQEETNIILNNPQIYLQLNNPMAKYNLTAQAGLTITTHRNNSADQSFSLDNEYFVIGGNAENSINTMCMSPTQPQYYYQGYEQATYIPFSSLSYLFSGKGMPNSVSIDITNPAIPSQKVIDFLLGENLGSVNGKYTFYAPLDLKYGSTITYTDKITGMGNEDSELLAITKLGIEALVTNNIPFDFTITAYPIDANGEFIEDVTIETIDIVANSVDRPLKFTINGNIENFDGIYFEAIAKAPETGSNFNPTTTISLKDLKVTISGNLISEF